MGILDSIMFWKKKEPDFGDIGGFDKEFKGGAPDLAMPGDEQLGLKPGPGQPGMPEQPGMPGQQMPGAEAQPQMGGMPKLEPAPQQPSFQQAPPPQPSYSPPPPSGGHGKDMELISVKIDQLRTSLDILNQRIANIERMLESQRPKW